MLKYDAFISYSHALDKPVARELQRVIQVLGKPWYKLRACRVFRDDTSLSAAPEMWDSIERALESSRYLILLASPEAGASRWVNAEVEWWLKNRDPSTILVGLTGGELVWSNDRQSFIPMPDFALPQALEQKFESEPFWIDLREWRSPEKAASGDTNFRGIASKFAAHIRAIPLEDLWSEELRQQKRNLRLAGSAVALLVALTVFGAFWLVRAIAQERQAHANEARAQMQLAILNSDRSATGDALRAALDSVEAANQGATPPSELEADLYQVSSKARHGLIAIGALQWPDGLKNNRFDEMYFTADGAAVCLLTDRDAENEEATFNTCFAAKDGGIVWQPELKPAQRPANGRATDLDARISGNKLEFRTSEEAGGKLVFSSSKSSFGNFLDDGWLGAKLCPDGRYIATRVNRAEKPSEDAEPIHHGSDVYIIELGTKKISRISDEFWVDAVTCSPFGKVIAGAGERGHIKFYDLAGEYVVAESVTGLSRFAAEGALPAFSENGHILIPSMVEIDGNSSEVQLIPAALDDSPAEQTLTFPPMGGVHAETVALSKDGRYAALLYGGDILTLWDLDEFGVRRKQEAGDEPDQTDDSADWAAQNRRIQEAVSAFKSNVPGAGTLKCITVDERQPRVVGYSQNRLVIYDLAATKVTTDRSGTFLNLNDDSCGDDGYTSSSNLEVIAAADGVDAMCDGINDRPACEFFLKGSSSSWITKEALPSSCHAVFRSPDLWLCGLGDPNDETTDATLAAIHWKKQKVAVSRDEFFEHVFAHHLGVSDFVIRRSDECTRMLISYSNWQRGGGAPQPRGSLILDAETAASVARVYDKGHPVFCSFAALVEHVRTLSERYKPKPVVIGTSEAVSRVEQQ